MEAASTCEIARLPEDLLSGAISRTTPRDACRATAVSPAFRAAADSDAVWSCFLPSDLPPLADGELHQPAPPSKKELFMRLSDGPAVLLDGGLMTMWLDKESGAKCYMLSARALCIIGGDSPKHWRWIPLADSRFAEAAELRAICWLEICGKMHSQMLSQNTKYAAYMVFKISDKHFGLDSPSQEVAVSIGGNRRWIHKACLQPSRARFMRGDRCVPPPGAHLELPWERADGWMELEMGEFFNGGADEDDGDVSISLTEKKGGHWKKGLVVHGIEIRAKK